MRKLAAVVIILSAYYVFQPGQLKISDTGTAYKSSPVQVNSCQNAYDEFSKGIGSELDSRLDIALLHYRKAHELCPDYQMFTDTYNRLEKRLENRIWFKT